MDRQSVALLCGTLACQGSGLVPHTVSHTVVTAYHVLISKKLPTAAL